MAKNSRTKNFAQKSLDGFSLLELVLAISIFAIGSIVAVNLIIDANTSTRVDLDKAEAVQIAREGIEAVTSIRDSATNASTTDATAFATPFSSCVPGPCGLASGAGGYGWVFSGTASDTVDVKFHRSLTITLNPASAPFTSASMAMVTSTVTWTSARNVPDSVSLTTILTNWRLARPTGM